MKLYGKLTKNICAIVLAVALFLISGIDAIEFVGKYKLREINGQGINSALFSEIGIGDVKFDFYISFDVFGKIGFDADIDIGKATLEELGVSDDMIKESIEEAKRQMKSATKGAKWSLANGEVLLSAPGEDVGRSEYSIDFGEITIIYEDGWDTETIVLKRAGLEGWLCPSMLLRAIALALLIFGLLSLLRKPKDAWDYTTPVAGGSVSNKPQEKVPEEPAKYCANCGGKIVAGDKFCQYCGTSAIEITKEVVLPPVKEEEEKPSSVATEGSRLKTTFKTTPQPSVVEENAPSHTVIEDKNEETESDNGNDFKPAGDL